MQEIGEVIKVKKNIVTVRVNRKSACGSCGMCAMKPKDLYVDIQLENTLDAKISDKVLIDINTGGIAKMSLVVYLIPLLLGMIPLTIAYLLQLKDWIAMISFFVGMALGFYLLSIIDKKVYGKKKNLPKMIEIIREKI